MKPILLVASLVLAATASASRKLPRLNPKTAVAYRACERCMLGNAKRFSKGRGSPDVQVSELAQYCGPKFKRLRTVVRKDLAKTFRGRRNVNVSVRAQMLTDLKRTQLKHTAVAMISKIRFER